MKNNFLKNYKFMLKTISRACASRVWLNIFFTVVNDLFSIFYNVLFFAYFMETVEKGESIIQVGKVLIIFVLINIVFELLNSYYNQKYIPQNDVKLSLFLKNMIYKKIMEVDIECFDNPEYYDNVTFTLNDLFERVKNILNNLSQFVSHLCCVIVLIGYFAQVDFVIVLISLISVSMGLFFEPVINKQRYHYVNEGLKYQRKYDYVKRISIQAEYAQELRTTNVKNVLNKMLDNAFLGLRALLKIYYRKISMFDSVNAFFGFGIVSCLTTLISLYRIIIDKSITIAMFLPLLGAIAQFTWRASSVIGSFNDILNDNIYLNKFNEFYKYEPKIFLQKGEMVDVPFGGIKIEHLYFKYDNDDDYTLRDICMEVQPKQKIALVGYNGAGKSTLINLILRLYDPEQGSITYNQKNICDYNIKDYRSKYGIVFQDINVYAATIGQNIAMDTEVYSDAEMQNIMNLLHLREKIDNYKSGFNTQLTHELSDSGEMLSIGQSQCLALARVFINQQKQLYILDEPTSALDPIAEEEIFGTINSYLEDKTVIYISHRFSASKIADKIYFMENGRIIEQGTHDELIRQKGKYADMFNLQAKYYKDDSSECIG
ncbi:MAG: ABC transporter ATP-binding protein [Lachnospiraceae bacterium]|jgi:ATP-binding cassette subfamily B protein|nr:ABC transporter ATP-binding protein [Lachnospiraceae bacterium]MCX4346598.1 ABC transporter ATP-binding protein [Lachnospiraceae bacterium]